MSYHETLESYRRAFQPTIPTALHDLSFLECAHDRRATIDEEIRELFPYLDTDWIMKVVSSSEATERGPLRVGVVFSGGPAPGGHTVLAGLFDTLKEWHPDSTLIGFLVGPT